MKNNTSRQYHYALIWAEFNRFHKLTRYVSTESHNNLYGYNTVKILFERKSDERLSDKKSGIIHDKMKEYE